MCGCKAAMTNARVRRLLRYAERVYVLRHGTNRRWWELQEDEEFWESFREAMEQTHTRGHRQRGVLRRTVPRG